MIEIHEKKCTCSYCYAQDFPFIDMGKPLHYGLNIPPHWNGPTAWYVIKYGPRHYIRWTNHWFRWFMRKERIK